MSTVNDTNLGTSPAPTPVGFDAKVDSPRTLHALLAQRVALFGDRRAYSYLGIHGDEYISFTELNRRAQAIAARIHQVAKPGDRALLVFPAGLDFITSFFGCLYAGVLAVPATYPKPRRPMPRLSAIARDCNATLALTTASTLATMDRAQDESGLPEMPFIAVDEVDEDLAGECPSLAIGSDDLAFLQYTSGSTSEPRGVMVSHGNLLHNLEVIRYGFGLETARPDAPLATGVFWLPAYHDMGLIGGILETLFVGGHSVLMSPAAFLQRPIGWLEAMSDNKACVSGAPNFAYEMCAARATDEQVEKLDLSSWNVAFCGAEPIRAETLETFARRFEPSGFSASSFYPCYGLAEATLLATGGVGPSKPVVRRFVREHLERNVVELANGHDESRTQRLVGCGQPLLRQELAIVDPETCVRCEPGHIGEIWLRGDSVAQGYWNRSEDTAMAFQSRLAVTNEGPYLRTGDLGFVSEDQLFVTGRVKDVIIIRGRNHYPQDIERTIGDAHDALRRDSGAVFSLKSNGEEQLAVVQEVDRHYRKADFDEIIRHIRRAVAASHELEIHTVVLIRHASLSRTTSGKAQRSLCCQQLENDDLNVLARWSKDDEQAAESSAGEAAAKHPRTPERIVSTQRPLTVDDVDRLAERVESWLLTWMVERAAIPPDEVDRDKPFADYGLDSLTAVELSHQLEDWLGVEVVPTVAWNYPTPATLSKYLAREAGGMNDDDADGHVATPLVDDEFSLLLAEIENLSDEDAQALLDDEANA
jgi:acyl-CoA synthetase (AMP-forming)/AMP-acid ligase II/acyl carrier protein